MRQSKIAYQWATQNATPTKPLVVSDQFFRGVSDKAALITKLNRAGIRVFAYSTTTGDGALLTHVKNPSLHLVGEQGGWWQAGANVIILHDYNTIHGVK